jgi:hypothetical protein
MKIGRLVLFVAIALSVALAGCAKAEPTPAVEVESGGAGLGPGGPGGGLRGATGLALGTLKLEGTEHALTAAQAAELLPLWKMIQGGSLQGAAETEAVLKQIEGQMDEAQLAAIEEMGLTFRDIGPWMQEQGIEMPTRAAGQGGPGAFQNMTEEERNKLREEFQNMTPEQRATRMAEMGFERPEGGGQGGGPGGGPGGGSGRGQGFAGGGAGNLMIDPLIELLTARAAE